MLARIRLDADSPTSSLWPEKVTSSGYDNLVASLNSTGLYPLQRREWKAFPSEVFGLLGALVH